MRHQQSEPSPAAVRASTIWLNAAGLFQLEVVTSAGRTVTVSLRGEVESSTPARLRSAFAAIDVARTPEVDLRLSGLEFCDLPSAREVIDLAYDVRSRGGTVRVSDPPNCFVHMLLTMLDVAGDLPLEEVSSPRDEESIDS